MPILPACAKMADPKPSACLTNMHLKICKDKSA